MNNLGPSSDSESEISDLEKAVDDAAEDPVGAADKLVDDDLLDEEGNFKKSDDSSNSDD